MTPKQVLIFIILAMLSLTLFVKIQVGESTGHYLRFLAKRWFSGDEVYYLRMTQSLVTDGNTELSNLWGLAGMRTEDRDPSVKALVPADEPLKYGLHFTGKDGGTYALHMPGMPFLIAPAFKLDLWLFPNDPALDPPYLPLLPQKLYFLHLLLWFIALLALILLYRLLQASFGSLFLGFILMLFWILNSPFTGYIFQLVPELWAVFFSLLTINAIILPLKQKRINAFFMVVGIGGLPWIHQRFISLALGLFLAYFFYRFKEPGFFKRTIVLIVILGVIAGCYFYYFYSLTGSPSPTSPWELHGKKRPNFTNLPLGFFGNIFHPKAGFIWNYPWTLLSLLGIYWGFKKNFRLTVCILLIVLPYFIMTSTAITWSGATWPRNRLLVAVYPLLVFFAGFSLQDLWQKFSIPKLAYYLSLLGVILLNRALWFINFPFTDAFPHPFIRSVDIMWIFKSILLLLFIYLSVFLLNKRVFSNGTYDLRNII